MTRRRILVLQLCRIGDILQTTPMLRALRREDPDAEITLVLHDVFKHVPVPSRFYDRLVAFPYTTMAGALSRSSSTWRAQMGTLRDFLADLGPDPFDLVLNLTHSDLSGFLCALVPNRGIEGALVAPDRTRVVLGRWMTYFWASQTLRAQGCFNLVDLHTWAAGVSADGQPIEIAVSEAARGRVHALLAERSLGARPMIAVQLGASEERKRWHPERFAATMNLLPADVYDVLFIGTEDEQSLFDRAAAHLARPAHHLLGKTKLVELPALLERCVLLLTNDTGTMHVAAAVGTTVVDLSSGPVFVHETAPYGEGHFVLEPNIVCFPCTAGADCHHFACRDDFVPEDVVALVRHALGEGPLPHPPTARIMTGRFQPNGRIEYRAIWPETPTRAEVLRQASARMWEDTLDAPPRAGENVARPDRAGARASRPAAVERRRLDLAVVDDWAGIRVALERFAHSADRIAALATEVRRADGTRLGALSKDIETGLRDLQVLGQLEPVCQPIAAFLRVTIESTFARDVDAVAGTYARECAAAARRARRLAELLAAPTSAAIARAG